MAFRNVFKTAASLITTLFTTSNDNSSPQSATNPPADVKDAKTVPHPADELAKELMALITPQSLSSIDAKRQIAGKSNVELEEYNQAVLTIVLFSMNPALLGKYYTPQLFIFGNKFMPKQLIDLIWAYLGCTEADIIALFKPDFHPKIAAPLRAYKNHISGLIDARNKLMGSEVENWENQAQALLKKHPYLEDEFNRLMDTDKGATLQSVATHLGEMGKLAIHVPFPVMCALASSDFIDCLSIRRYIQGPTLVFPALEMTKVKDETGQDQDILKIIQASSQVMENDPKLQNASIIIGWSGGMAGPFCLLRRPDNGKWLLLMVSVGASREDYQKFCDEMSTPIKTNLTRVIQYQIATGDLQRTSTEETKSGFNRTLNNCLPFPHVILMPEDAIILCDAQQGIDPDFDTFVQSGDGDFYDLALMNTIELKCDDEIGIYYRVTGLDNHVKAGLIPSQEFPNQIVPSFTMISIDHLVKRRILELASIKELDEDLYSLAPMQTHTNIIECHCDEAKGLHYRLIRKDNTVETGLIEWKLLPKDFPRNDKVFFKQKEKLLPDVLKTLNLAQNQACLWEPGHRELKSDGVHCIHTGDKLDSSGMHRQYVCISPPRSGDKYKHYMMLASAFHKKMDARHNRKAEAYIVTPADEDKTIPKFQAESKTKQGAKFNPQIEALVKKHIQGKQPATKISTAAFAGGHGFAVAVVTYIPGLRRNILTIWNHALTAEFEATPDKLRETLTLFQKDFQPFIESEKFQALVVRLVATEHAPHPEPLELKDFVEMHSQHVKLMQTLQTAPDAETIMTYRKLHAIFSQHHVPVHRDVTARNVLLTPKLEEGLSLQEKNEEIENPTKEEAIKRLMQDNPAMTEEVAVTVHNIMQDKLQYSGISGITAEALLTFAELNGRIFDKSRDPEVTTFIERFQMTIFAYSGQKTILTNSAAEIVLRSRERYKKVNQENGAQSGSAPSAP